MSLTKEALEHLEASHKTGTEVLDGEALIMGCEFKLADLEKYRAMRRRFRGKFETQGIDDFTRYVGNNGPARAPVFIDRDAMAARCYLDIGHVHEPGHCEHSASLALPKTPEFTAFLRAMALDAITAAIAEEFAGCIEEALPELECLQGTFSP